MSAGPDPGVNLPKALLLEAASACQRWAPGCAAILRAGAADQAERLGLTEVEAFVRETLAAYQPPPGQLDGWGRLPRALRADLADGSRP